MTDDFVIDKDGRTVYQKTTSDERLLAMLIYALSFFTAIIGPLIIWLIKKDASSFVDYHGRQYFDFFISYFIYSLIGSVLAIILIGIPIVIAVAVGGLIFTILAAVKAFQGERYRIPFIFRILS